MAKLYVLLALLCAISSSLAVTDREIEEFLDVCIDSKHHKEKPGPEADVFNQTFHCTPWKNHACCTANTTFNIKKDGVFTLYRMHWDQCNRPMSPKCRRFFEVDTCMYECSPYMNPWIARDTVSKVTRKERFQHVPMCSEDCDAWYEACKGDYTCSDNWGDQKTWNWTKQGNMCKKQCKTFQEYYGDAKTFCNRLFNYSWKYTEGVKGEDCMTMWPNGTTNINRKVAEKRAREIILIRSSASKLASAFSALILLTASTVCLI